MCQERNGHFILYELENGCEVFESSISLTPARPASFNLSDIPNEKDALVVLS